jgi:hypothetical protein
VFGRPESTASTDTADKIADTWYSLGEFDDLVDRYIALHFRHYANFKISILWGVVQEVESSAVRAKPAQPMTARTRA